MRRPARRGRGASGDRSLMPAMSSLVDRAVAPGHLPLQEARMPEREPSGRDEIVDRLFGLFRAGGFAGVSIADIAAATGLGRSSLYHHFPGGKEEMAEAVIARVEAATANRLLAPLAAGARDERVRGMMRAASELYGGGAQPCLIASFLVGDPPPPLRDMLRRILAGWIDALARALEETGAEPTGAREAATDAIARIQGALVLARALEDPTVFTEATEAAERDLIAV